MPISRLLTAAILTLLGPHMAFADPCGMVPPVQLTPGAPQLTRVGDQITYVFFKTALKTSSCVRALRAP
jgi:hypothetical protein